jgi:hypothetical protein
MDTHLYYDTTVGGHLPGLDLSRVPLHAGQDWIQGRAVGMRALGCSEAHVAAYVARDTARTQLPPTDGAPGLAGVRPVPLAPAVAALAAAVDERFGPGPLPDAYAPVAW